MARTSSAAGDLPESAARLLPEPGPQLLGNRFFTFTTVVRVNQIETSRDVTNGEDELHIHGPEEACTFRETVEKGWPGARITWALRMLVNPYDAESPLQPSGLLGPVTVSVVAK